MSEPGKYVLLQKVQPSSKNIKKSEKQKEKKLKKKLQQKQLASEVPKRNGTNTQEPNGKIGSKKKRTKQKQKQLKGNKTERNSVEKESQRDAGAKNKKQKLDSNRSSLSPKKTFGDDLSDRLKASRFRFINEQLYTQTSDQALDVFKQDDSAFGAYHDGYRKQIEQWPINPLDRIIKSIKKL